MNNKNMKKCRDCGLEKDIAEFATRSNPNRTKTQYHISYCRECMVKRSTRWIKDNREKYNDYQKKWHCLLKEKIV